MKKAVLNFGQPFLMPDNKAGKMLILTIFTHCEPLRLLCESWCDNVLKFNHRGTQSIH